MSEWLNYRHLLYFRAIAKAGGVSAAAKQLRLSQSTLSTQLQLLESALAVELFRRVGRGVQLTDEGRAVMRYADEIFALGAELLEGAKQPSALRSNRSLVVGISDVLPKLLVHQLLSPLISGTLRVRLACVEGNRMRLIERLDAYELDVVLSDAPCAHSLSQGVESTCIGRSSMSFYATPELATRARARFPDSLHQLPFLLTAEHTSMRLRLNAWFEREGLRPDVVAEFDDGALLKTFAAAGEGAFIGPSMLASALHAQYGVEAFGTAPDLEETYYVLSANRRLQHPAIERLVASALASFAP